MNSANMMNTVKVGGKQGNAKNQIHTRYNTHIHSKVQTERKERGNEPVETHNQMISSASEALGPAQENPG